MMGMVAFVLKEMESHGNPKKHVPHLEEPVPHPNVRPATQDDLSTAAMLGQRLKLSRGLLNPTGLREPTKEDARYWHTNHHVIVEPYTWQDILWLQLDASDLLD